MIALRIASVNGVVGQKLTFSSSMNLKSTPTRFIFVVLCCLSSLLLFRSHNFLVLIVSVWRIWCVVHFVDSELPFLTKDLRQLISLLGLESPLYCLLVVVHCSLPPFNALAADSVSPCSLPLTIPPPPPPSTPPQGLCHQLCQKLHMESHRQRQCLNLLRISCVYNDEPCGLKCTVARAISLWCNQARGWGLRPMKQTNDEDSAFEQGEKRG